MNNLIDIQNQIEKLQKQADEIKSKEFDKTVREIVVKMQAFGITVKNLRPAGVQGRKSGKGVAVNSHNKGKGKKTGATTVTAKYRGPNGEAWSGRGLTPRWLAALVIQGKKKEEFAIPN